MRRPSSTPREPHRVNSAELAFVPKPTDVPVVGIGVSGGLEAFFEILTHLPANPSFAIVLVQHPMAGQSCLSPETLQRFTGLPVVEAAEDTPIREGIIYTIPPYTPMRLSRGSLRPVRRHAADTNPIDALFQSLANECGRRAVGVILSGGAFDGALGLQSIKGAEGITFAQDHSARCDTMPRFVVQTGCVDHVLPPAEIAQELLRLSYHPHLGSSPPQDTLTDADWHVICSLLFEDSRIDLNDRNRGAADSHIRRRMTLRNCLTIKEYLVVLEHARQERQALFHDIASHPVYFFRDPALFEFLKAKVYPMLLSRVRPGAPLRIWHPGCSTGEEAYSIAISLNEALSDRDIPVQLYGTDIDGENLERARAGLYPDWISAQVAQERLRRYFQAEAGHFRVTPAIREICRFGNHHLGKSAPFCRVDLIVCNMLEWLTPSAQRRVLDSFQYALNPHGVLVLGSRETPGVAELFSALQERHAVYQRKGYSPSFEAQGVSYTFRGAALAAPPPSSRKPPKPELVYDILLRRHCPPAILVDADLTVLRVYGRSTPYLQKQSVRNGEGFSVLRMANGALGTELARLIARARRLEATVRSQETELIYQETSYHVHLSVVPIESDPEQPASFLVVFEESVPATALRRRTSRRGNSMTPKDVLSAEAMALLEEQQYAIESLTVANEEILASGEELRLMNAHLVQTREELESTVHELTTLNEEVHARNSELQRIGSDLTNLLRNLSFPLVIVDNDLRIQRFTPAAERLLNLTAADIGKAVADWRPRVPLPRLDQVFADVVTGLKSYQGKVTDPREGDFWVSVRPYRLEGDRLGGAVLTMVGLAGEEFPPPGAPGR
jgi:two-component system CheB/CheR fusion protein